MSRQQTMQKNRFIPKAISPMRPAKSRFLTQRKERKNSHDFKNNEEKGINHTMQILNDIKRKFTTAPIPASKLHSIFEQIQAVKATVATGLDVKSEINAFWNEWDELVRITSKLTSQSAVEKQTKEITQNLTKALKLMLDNKENDKIFKSVYEDLRKLMRELDNTQKYSEDFFQVFMNSLLKAKRDITLKGSRDNIGLACSAAQKLRELYKFKEISEKMINNAQKYFLKTHPKIPDGELQNFEIPEPKEEEEEEEKNEIVDEILTQKIEELVIKRGAIAHHNQEMKDKIAKKSVSIETKEKKMENLQNLIVKERKKTHDRKLEKIKEERKAYNDPTEKNQLTKLEREFKEINIKVETQKRFGEIATLTEIKEYLRQEKRRLIIDNEVVQKDLDDLLSINESINPSGDQIEMKVYNSSIIEKERDLQQQLIAEQRALEIALKNRDDDFSFDNLTDYDQLLLLYQSALQESEDLKKIIRETNIENETIERKIEKNKDNKTDVNESSEWLECVMDEYSQLEREYLEIKSRASIPQISDLEKQLKDKSKELKSLNKKPDVDETTQRIIDDTIDATNELLEVSKKYDKTEESSHNVIDSDIEQQTKRLEQSYIQRSGLRKQKDEVVLEMGRLFKAVCGNSPGKYSVDQMLEMILKKI